MHPAAPPVLPLERQRTAAPQDGSERPVLRSVLKLHTTGAHEALEATALMQAFASGTLSAAAYAEYLARQLRLHQPVEAALSPWLTPDAARLRLCKSDWLRSDLLAMGGPCVKVEPDPQPVIGSWAEALGAMYVLEGGTLGLQVVRKRLPEGHPARGLAGRFMHGYGEHTGQHWRSFVDLLERLPPPEWPMAMGAAQALFERFHGVFAKALAPPT